MAPTLVSAVVFASLSAFLSHAAGPHDCDAANAACAVKGVPDPLNLDEIEAEEEAEARMMEMILLQTRAPITTERSATADLVQSSTDDAASRLVQAELTSAETNSSGAFSYDHNGRVCVFCGKPLPERLGDQRFTEFRTDCGGFSGTHGPTADALEKPVMDFSSLKSSSGAATNGFCELNFAKSCVDAVANEDYTYFAKGIDMLHPDMKDGIQFDARYCHLNGFLEPDVVALQRNFTGLRARALELCETKYRKHGIDTVTFKGIMGKSHADDVAGPSLVDAEILAAWNCAMGDLACDMAACSYSFCSKGEGKFGVYGECDQWDPVRGMPF